MVDAARSKIISVRSDDPKRPIILAGVGVSAAIACQVCIQLNTLISIFNYINILYYIINSKMLTIRLFDSHLILY